MMGGIRAKALQIAAAVGCAMLIGGCGQSADVNYRYRVTVEVDTPQGLRSGSSVWETTAWEGSGIPDTAIRSRERGEAVAVDLPGGTLFALLRSPDLQYDYASGVVPSLVRRYPPPGFPETKDWKELGHAIATKKPAFELYPDEYPLLVRFRDINDPASVEKVEPANLAASFAPGVKLRRITVAVTEDDVTEGIVERLLWLRQQRGSLQKMPPGTRRRDTPLAGRLTEGDFVAGGL